MSTISALLIDCLRDFNALLGRGDLAAHEIEVPMNLWKDELGRLRVWASNIGAHQTGQSSLDFRLRDASHIKDQTIKLLQRLRRILKDLEELLNDPDHDNASSSANQDDEPETQEIYESLVDAISCLFQLSMVIRRPIQHDRLLGTRKADAAPFEPYDRVHVGQKYPRLTQVVVDRLGSAISRRRASLRYRERHHAKLSKNIDHVVDETKDATSTQLSETIATGFVEQTNITFDDTASTSGVSQTSYAPSLWEGSDRLTVPPPPKESANEQPFECPYCFYIVTIRDKTSWVRHVFRDLMPYTCVFPDCSAPNQLYNSRREWFHHMRSAHTSELDSQSQCPLQCSTASISAMHLESHIGRHLEELALFAMPRAIPDDEGDPENRQSTSSWEEEDWERDVDDDGGSVSEGNVYDDERALVADASDPSTIGHQPTANPIPPANTDSDSDNEQAFRLRYDPVPRNSETKTDVERPTATPNGGAVPSKSPWTQIPKGLVDVQVLRSRGLDFEEDEIFYYVFADLSHETLYSILLQSQSTGNETDSQASEADEEGISTHRALKRGGLLMLRPSRDDEYFVMYRFAKHASKCTLCADPYDSYQQGHGLCDRGRSYARYVFSHLSYRGGKAFSRIDRAYGNPIEVRIPAECEVIHGLFRALEHGMGLSRRKKPTIVDPNEKPVIVEMLPRRVKETRDVQQLEEPSLAVLPPDETEGRTYEILRLVNASNEVYHHPKDMRLPVSADAPLDPNLLEGDPEPEVEHYRRSFDVSTSRGDSIGNWDFVQSPNLLDFRTEEAEQSKLLQHEENDEMQSTEQDEGTATKASERDVQTPKGSFTDSQGMYVENSDSGREQFKLSEDSNHDEEILRDAAWTKISRALVNPEALEEAGESFEAGDDYVIVHRVVRQAEITRLSKRTAEIREERERQWMIEHERREADLEEDKTVQEEVKRRAELIRKEDDDDYMIPGWGASFGPIFKKNEF
ncbi:uncharacterized protein PV06_02118 [Exophiala oligosperma]|uniref:C2H2-type domain-containing protein n=1 Tax=Exophiala oligosperma TaxID=215243 RepID=A0A0D2B2P1_9EURO|nr:uncharacterized protein PV06_02118 [Exophiala oligosperma]KIW46446.1 hypothetical protein PV06_02118 [Exophiala oligosperma]